MIKGFNTQQQQQVQTVVEENMSNLTSASGEQQQQQQTSVSSENGAQQQPSSVVKKKRNLPGNPDPEAEVISLSPKTLMARNRFVCEICNKGFQRDQNLQLHRRGHNLPWKLKQRSNKEVRKKVYICPETSCVHHDPTRALGDLTGIKKHFSRKHGEKKWKCEKCSKKYAVQSDWKAHSKTCGTREYRCDCGTLFSRRDSFITHRAFCDALAEETSKTQSTATLINTNNPVYIPHQFTPPPPLSPRSQSYSQQQQHFNQFQHYPLTIKTEQQQHQTMLFNESNNDVNGGGPYYPQLTPSSPHMSATALLQKAAQMGATMNQTPNSSNSNSNINTAGHTTTFALNLSSSDQHQQNHQMGGNANLTYTLTGNTVPLPPVTTTSTLSAGHHFFHDMMMNSFQDHDFDDQFDHETISRNSTSSHHDENGVTRDFLGLRPIISQSDFLNIAGDLGNCIDHDDNNHDHDHDSTFEENHKSWQGN